MEIIRQGYSFHETSGPAAPPPPEEPESFHTEGGVDSEEHAGGDGGDAGALSVVGKALGGAALGVAGAVRNGFGIGRLFGRTTASPGEEVADAIGTGSVGFAGSVLAGAAGPGAADAGEKTGVSDSNAAIRGVDNAAGDACPESDMATAASDASDTSTAGTGPPASQDVQYARDEDPRFVSGAPEAAASKDDVVEVVAKGSPSLNREETTGGALPEGQSGGGGVTGERGIGGSNCAALAGEVAASGDDAGVPGGGGPGPAARARPTAVHAAEMDALVGDAMVNYWASFGKVMCCCRWWGRAVRGFRVCV